MRIKLLFFKTAKKEILLWDDNCQEIIKKSFGQHSWVSINTRDFINISPLNIVSSLYIFSNNYKRIFACSLGKTNSKLNIDLKIFKFLKRIKYSFETILALSVILHYDPKVILSNTDNSALLEYLDSIIHEKIPVITVQNGNRWHNYELEKCKGLEHFYRPSGFHSCFAALSKCDIDMYTKNGWICNEYHIVGSLYSEASLDKNFIKNFFDICVVAESNNTRKSTSMLSKLLRNFQKNKSYKICVVLKRSPNEENFRNYYKEIYDLFGDFAILIPNNSKNISQILSSNVVVGNFSTVLRDVFSFGKKILPVNFDVNSLNSYMQNLGINLKPNQDEFNYYLTELLNISNENYIERYKELIDYLGSYPQDITPTSRLYELIERKIKNCKS